MREVIGDRTVDEVITIGRQDIEVSALTRMQELAKRYKLGVRVDQVQLKNVNPPREVQASFNEVNKAQQDRENAINIANGDYNEAVPKAKGQADQTIRGAEGYRFKRVNEAEGDVASFNAMLDAIQQGAGDHPDPALPGNDGRRAALHGAQDHHRRFDEAAAADPAALAQTAGGPMNKRGCLWLLVIAGALLVVPRRSQLLLRGAPD